MKIYKVLGVSVICLMITVLVCICFGNTTSRGPAEADNTAKEETEYIKESQSEEMTYEEIVSDLPIVDYDGVVTVGNSGYELFNYREETAIGYSQAVTGLANQLEGKANVYCILVPLSSEIVFPDNLKGEINSSSQKEAMYRIFEMTGEKVYDVNIYPELMSHRTEYLYFRTDHHWTARGSYYAYKTWAKKKGLDYQEWDDFQIAEYSGFLGSFYKDTNQSEELANGVDTVYAPIPNSNATMHVYTAEGDQYDWPIINDVSNYKSAYKYATFIAGDNPYTTIVNHDISDNSACIVVKESFGNAFVPYLVDHYQYIYILDYRYCSGTVSELVQHTKAKDVILINNISMTRNKYLVGQFQSVVQ